MSNSSQMSQVLVYHSIHIRRRIKLPILWYCWCIQVWQPMHKALGSLTGRCLQSSAYYWHLHLIKKKYFWHSCETLQSGSVSYSPLCSATRRMLAQSQRKKNNNHCSALCAQHTLYLRVDPGFKAATIASFQFQAEFQDKDVVKYWIMSMRPLKTSRSK